MAIIKCKMCGGDMELAADKTYGMCEFCGSTMTLPKIDDEQRAAAFNRGNHFRRIGEFDKALAVYERIVREDDTDAEAHWCCALSRFGIEYVEDPTTYEWIPTCHRASFDSFLEDVDYLAAVEHSEGITKRQYQKDGAKIAEVQRGILVTSQNEEPFDVFICYKESDETGERTKDSLMAQDVYYQLTDQGYRVFFARITLEDMVGKQYEPYIFAALTSAKVMIVIGTKAEYMNAVWVKNEWSRFLAMMRKDRSKLLLPCYRDMDPYDMPEQLSVLQSYDMSKIGFIQDLIRGIKKVLDADKKVDTQTTVMQETVVVNASSNVEPLLKRAYMFLEDEEWDSADEYCEKVLDMDPENAMAYVGKLMVELRVKTMHDLHNYKETFEENNYYKKAMRFAHDDLKLSLNDALTTIGNRIIENKYVEAKNKMKRAKTEADYVDLFALFKEIENYKDSFELAQKCEAAYKELFTESKYATAVAMLKTANSESKYKELAEVFEFISEYKDSAVLAQECYKKAEEKRQEKIQEKLQEKIKCDELFNKYIEAMEHGAVWEKQKAEASRKLPFFRNDHSRLSQLKNNWKQIEAAMAHCSYRIQAAQNEIEKLSHEKAGLGVFDIKRKREIEERITSLTNEVNLLQVKYNSEKEKAQGYTSYAEICSAIDRLEKKINEQTKALELLSSESIRAKLESFEYGMELLRDYDAQNAH